MDGLMWGAFLGGVVGMAKDIFVSEYNSMQDERKEKARASTQGFLYQLSDLENSFLCLYENCGPVDSVRQKLNVAANYLNKVAEIYFRLKENQESQLTLAHVVAGHNKELGTIALREATRDMIRCNADANLNVINSSRKSIEANMNDVYKYIHTRSLMPGNKRKRPD